MHRNRFLAFLAAVAAVAAVAAPGALGSVLIARSTKDVKLKVTSQGQAVLTFRKGREVRNMVAWGALNARPHPKCGKVHGPRCGPAQVQMSKRRIVASGRLGRRILNAPDRCRRYDGPALPHLVAACRAPDGSYWAAQSWIRLHKPGTTTGKGVPELRLSHWSGPVAKLVIKQNWVVSKRHYYHNLFGNVTYQNKAVYGLEWNRKGVPQDGFGRVIYFDTLNSHWGPGWRRAQGFLSKPWNGQFCYSLWGKDWGSPNWKGEGEAYRAMAMGPGVTPDVAAAPFTANQVTDADLVTKGDRRVLTGEKLDWQIETYSEQLALSQGSRFCVPQARSEWTTPPSHGSMSSLFDRFG